MLGWKEVPTGRWTCDVCLMQNNPELTKCAACTSAKPGSTGAGFSGFGSSTVNSSSWTCNTCLVQNKEEVQLCVLCSASKPASKLDPTKAVDSKACVSGFVFGQKLPESSTSTTFTFGGFNLAQKAPRIQPAEPESSKTKGGRDEEIRADGKDDDGEGRIQQELSEECEPCTFASYIRPAVGWCKTCDELLCNTCFETHLRPKGMRNHQLCSITDMKMRKQRVRVADTCEKHRGKVLKYFCEDHSEVGCSQCVVTKHRPCQKMVCIAEVKTSKSEEFKALVSLLSDLETKLKVNEETAERNVTLTERQHNNAIADIKEAGDKLKTFIDVLVKKQIGKTEEIRANNVRNLTEIDEAFKTLSMKIQTNKEMLAAEKEDNHQLFLTTKHLQREAKLLKSKLRECEKKNKVIEHEFVLNSELAAVLEKVTDLGTLSDLQLLNQEKATDEFVEEVEVRNFLSVLGEWRYKRGEKYAIGITPDHNIELLDVLLYPCREGDTKVALTVSEGGRCLVNCSSTHENTPTRDVVYVTVVNERGGRGVTLQAGHQYDVAVMITGSNSQCGRNGQANVTVDGVTFSLSRTYSPNGTRVRHGQIPGFRFTRL